MTELIDLPEVTEPNVTDDDYLLVWDAGASSNKSRKCTRGRLLKDVVRTSGTFETGTLNATGSLNAPEAALDELTTSKVIIGAALTNIVVATVSAAIPEALTFEEVTVGLAIPGVLTGDMVTIHAGASFPAGMMVRATVTASDVVTLYAFNATVGTIAAASHSLKVLAVRAEPA